MAMSLKDALARHGINVPRAPQQQGNQTMQVDPEEEKRRQKAQLDQMYKNAFGRYMRGRR